MIDLFFFKQKTAYEMRISDWSSDVCSSDLLERRADRLRHQQRPILAGRPEISRAGIHGPALHFNADLAIVRHDRADVHIIVDIDPGPVDGARDASDVGDGVALGIAGIGADAVPRLQDRTSTRLNSSH